MAEPIFPAVVVPAGAGELLDLGRSGPRVLLSGAMSHARLTVLEVEQPPGGGPPLHVHSREDESFYVLDGSFIFECGHGDGAGSGCLRVVAGRDSASLPGRRRRWEAVDAVRAVRMEGYFCDWAGLVQAGDVDDAAMTRLAARYGLTLLGSYPADHDRP